MGKDLEQTVFFKATPHEVYEALMDSKKHAAFTEEKAEMSRDIGGKIMAYDGYIEGENIELVSDKKIVQKWRGANWPEGHFSIATFELREKDGGCELHFTQTNIPDDELEDVSKGWYTHYWDRMKVFFEKV